MENIIKETPAKEGDLISWDFNNPIFKGSFLYGNTYEAEVVNINIEEKYYDVYVSYGADKIPFDKCTIINKKQNNYDTY